MVEILEHVVPTNHQHHTQRHSFDNIGPQIHNFFSWAEPLDDHPMEQLRNERCCRCVTDIISVIQQHHTLDCWKTQLLTSQQSMMSVNSVVCYTALYMYCASALSMLSPTSTASYPFLMSLLSVGHHTGVRNTVCV